MSRADAQTPGAIVPILGVPISRLGFEGALEACAGRRAAGGGGYVCFANVHTVTESRESPELAQALRGAFLAFADGVPLLWVSKAKGQPVESRVCGPDFMKAFLAREAGSAHGFVGGREGQGEELARRFGLTGAACYSPPMRAFSAANAREDWNTLLGKSNAGRAPAYVWVGLGAPKQELWMKEISAIAPETLFFGVGAAFDFLTDAKERAPQWMQKSGLEWAFRLSQEPGRLWKRYLHTNSRFVWENLKEAGRGSRHS